MRKTEYTLPSKVRCTIGLVSDLHEQDPDDVLQILRETRPDVIAVTGDTLERHRRGDHLAKGDSSCSSRLVYAGIHMAESLAAIFCPALQVTHPENAYRFFEEAGRLAPVVLCRGNHKQYLTPQDLSAMEHAGVTILDNDSAEINGILFGGLPSKQSTGALDTALLETFSSSPKYKILLCHHPEYYPMLANYPIDLILCGHCHGGQIRVCGRGVFAPGQGLFPRYYHGVYHDGRMVVSAGCANTASIPRWGNETEVVILRLTGTANGPRSS